MLCFNVIYRIGYGKMIQRYRHEAGEDEGYIYRERETETERIHIL